MKSVFGGEGRRYYSLVHKVSSKYHKAGESQKIIVDQIELGRDPRCQVRYDESFSTVSRRHAAIVKDGDNWKLVPLSKTNSTYLNGRKLEKEWFLQNGDEIQLSTNGPKLGFIVPEGKAGLVKSIGLTARLSLFRQQALRPYKTAITSLACALVLCCGLGGYFIAHQGNTIKRQHEQLAELMDKYERFKSKYDTLVTSYKDVKTEAENAARRAAAAERRAAEANDKITQIETSSGDDFDWSELYPYVYYIETHSFVVDGERFTCPEGLGLTGTGFLLKDGKFVSARHVLFPHLDSPYLGVNNGELETPSGKWLYLANRFEQMEGLSVEFEFTAISTTDRFTFTSSVETTHANWNDLSFMEFGKDENGNKFYIEIYDTPIPLEKLLTGTADCNDFAYIETGRTEGLDYTAGESYNLTQGTQLSVLGFPHQMGVEMGGRKIAPILSTAICSQNGINNDTKMIIASNNNIEGGNSGGPIFVADSSARVVGIVRGTVYQKAQFVPLDHVFK